MGQLVFVIRISVPFTSLCQRIARCLPQAHGLCSENVAIGFKTSIDAYFMEKNSTRTLELLEVSKLCHNFGTKRVFIAKKRLFKIVPVLR